MSGTEEKGIKSRLYPRIKQYWHCKNCLNSDDVERQKQSGSLAVGWTPEGMQAFCERCNTNVCDIDLEGKKIKII